MMQSAIDASQHYVTGDVRLRLYKGTVTVTGRRSPHSLYSEALATFEDGGATYDHRDAGGFIRLVGLGARVVARRGGFS
jgi:argininosuccinate synthase